MNPVALWLRMLCGWVDKFNPDSIHIFWDCKKDTVWRKNVLQEYKEHRNANPRLNESKHSIDTMVFSLYKILRNLNVRQYMKKEQECDDLLYAMCRVLTPANLTESQCIIISSDTDFKQIIWNMSHVKLYNPGNDTIEKRPDIDPIMQKCIVGDTADNIHGYRGIGPVKSKKILEDPKKFKEFIDAFGNEILLRNISLIDLSANPSVAANELYVRSILASDVFYSIDEVKKLAVELKIAGLLSLVSDIGYRFEKLK